MYFDIRKPETTNKTFRLPSELLHKLEKVAQQKGVSLNYLVGQCCEYALANLRDTQEVSTDGGTI